MADDIALSGIYRRIWRWHFFAALFVMPFAIVLSITGSIYLFADEIEGFIDQRIDVRATDGERVLSAEAMVNIALSAHLDASLVRYIVPKEQAKSVRILIKTEKEQRLLWIDRASGAVLHDVRSKDRVLSIVKRIHSSLLAGRVGNILVELAASTMIILVISGIWLHWPRGRSLVFAIIPRFSTTGRTFWKSLHGSLGLIAGIFILGLLLTGLPWTSVWGEQFTKVRYAMGWIGPGQEWFVTLKSSFPPEVQAHKDDGLKLWSTSNDEGSVKLSSSSPVEAVVSKSVDWVLEAIVPEKLPHPIWIQPPRPNNGVWTVRAMPTERHLRQTLHFDQWTGEEIMRIRFDDYHPVEKAMGHGLSFHEGALFGVWNKILGVMITLSLIGLSLAGTLAWLKRRPAGKLAAPTLPDSQEGLPVFWVVLLVAVLIFLPVAGIAVAIIWTLDKFLILLKGRSFAKKHIS